MQIKRVFASAILLIAITDLQAAPQITAKEKNVFCGDLANRFGPHDYRKGNSALAHELWLVESTHFFPDVENLVKGRSGTLGGEIDYTLRAFPNHVRALSSLDRLALREKVTTVKDMRYPAECYFERAMRFAPDDGGVRGAYGNFLYARGKVEEALKMFIEAEKLTPNDPTINYNLALVYLKVRAYEKANFHAQRAYALGFPLPGLKNKLIGVGKWDDTIEVKVPEKADDGSMPEKADEGSAPKAE